MFSLSVFHVSLSLSVSPYGIENSWSICEQSLYFFFVKLLSPSLIYCINYFRKASRGIHIQLQILQILKR
jgi:hypothetical protein